MNQKRSDDSAMIVTMTRGELRALIREEQAASANGYALLTAEELAKALRMNKASVYQWVKQKTIPFYQSGRFVRFNLREVLDAQRRKSENLVDSL